MCCKVRLPAFEASPCELQRLISPIRHFLDIFCPTIQCLFPRDLIWHQFADCPTVRGDHCRDTLLVCLAYETRKFQKLREMIKSFSLRSPGRTASIRSIFADVCYNRGSEIPGSRLVMRSRVFFPLQRHLAPQLLDFSKVHSFVVWLDVLARRENIQNIQQQPQHAAFRNVCLKNPRYGSLGQTRKIFRRYRKRSEERTFREKN